MEMAPIVNVSLNVIFADYLMRTSTLRCILK